MLRIGQSRELPSLRDNGGLDQGGSKGGGETWVDPGMFLKAWLIAFADR